MEILKLKFFKIKILIINMSSPNINMYEKILKRITSTMIKESPEDLEKDLDHANKDLKMFTETIQNIEYIRNQYCEEFLDPDEIYDDKYQEYKFLLNGLIKKKNIVQEELKNIEEKYNKALEDKEMIEFLKNILKNF